MLATDRPTALARQPEILSGSAAGTDPWAALLPRRLPLLLGARDRLGQLLAGSGKQHAAQLTSADAREITIRTSIGLRRSGVVD